MASICAFAHSHFTHDVAMCGGWGVKHRWCPK